tara:strand:+ start:403 stop:1245 length:843 start_codon:yes stop_codon:yes gene_type:complete
MNTQDLKFFDPEEVFELNPDMKVQIFNVKDNYPVVLIDDVYKNPDMVREVALSTPVPQKTFFSAKRGQLYNFFDNWDTCKTLSKVLIEGLKLDTCLPDKVEVLDNGEKLFAFNVFEPKNFPSPPESYVPPHSDTSIIASVLYLNKDDETPIGTGIYQHIPSGLILYPQHDMHFEWICQQDNISPTDYIDKIVKYDKTASQHQNKDDAIYHGSSQARGESTYTVKGNSEWKLLYESPGTFNQICSYVGGTFHSPLINNTQFSSANFNRINQVIFWDYMDGK